MCNVWCEVCVLVMEESMVAGAGHDRDGEPRGGWLALAGMSQWVNMRVNVGMASMGLPYR